MRRDLRQTPQIGSVPAAHLHFIGEQYYPRYTEKVKPFRLHFFPYSGDKNVYITEKQVYSVSVE